jgi:acyl-CoA synthetase (AMP-forming)/AMP-acid ligase II
MTDRTLADLSRAHRRARGSKVAVRYPADGRSWTYEALDREACQVANALATLGVGAQDRVAYLYIHDRVKDMIISGGENIYPAEIENVLMAHPDIADAAVIGVPSERWGETVKAVITRRDNALTEEAVFAHCRQQLARYKCPTGVDWMDVIPRNPSGKILKRELRAPYWEGRERNLSQV